MNSRYVLPRRWMVVALIVVLVLIPAGILGEPAQDKKPVDKKPADKKPKADARRAAEMVDAIVNRNKAPKLVKWPGEFPSTKAALYPEDYDWKEEDRVRTALRAISKDMRVEVWEEMIRRGNDSGYSVVSTSVQLGDASLETVGGVCRELAYWRLVSVFWKHLPTTDGRRVRLDIGVDEENLTEWRKARADKSLYELQIEVCEAALQAPTRKRGKNAVPYLQGHKEARMKIEAAIDNLRKTKQPDFDRVSGVLLPYREFRYNAETAKRIRDGVNSGKYEPLWKLGLAPK